MLFDRVGASLSGGRSRERVVFVSNLFKVPSNGIVGSVPPFFPFTARLNMDAYCSVRCLLARDNVVQPGGWKTATAAGSSFCTVHIISSAIEINTFQLYQIFQSLNGTCKPIES